jgi:hypothetical protein
VRPAPSAVALEITTRGRVGARGIRLWGFHFTAEPTLVIVKDLSPGIGSRLCRFPELIVRELDADGNDVVLPNLPKRWGGRWPVPPVPLSAGSLATVARPAVSEAIAVGLAKARKAAPVMAAVTAAAHAPAGEEPRKRRPRAGGDDA